MTLVDRSELHLNSSGSARLGQVSGRDHLILGFAICVSQQSCTRFGFVVSVPGIPAGTIVLFPLLENSILHHQFGFARCTGTVASQEFFFVRPVVSACKRSLREWDLGALALLVNAVLLVGFRRVPALSHHEVCNHPWSLDDRVKMAMSPFACCSCAVCQMRSLVPCAVAAVHGAPGHNRWEVAETPLPGKSQGRNMDRLFIFIVSVSGVGCCLSVSRRGGQSPRYREHAQGADAVSTGPQQARNTEVSERTAAFGVPAGDHLPKWRAPTTTGRLHMF